jgi:hypothetical protein
MSVSPYWSEAYEELGPIFYELVGFYEKQFNRNPNITLDNQLYSSEILPVYNKEIKLPPYILYLSQLPLINRLTEIKQLSHTCILFPGATHTRYEHSLGVMYRARELLDTISLKLAKKGCRLKIAADERMILEISALLHDMGHPAWGHALDGITGYVVQLFKEMGYYLYSPKKLDNTLTMYLLTENEQMTEALNVCAQRINQRVIGNLLPQIVAQIIMEEEPAYFEELDEVPKLMKKIHLFTTIIGRYSKGSGINADRLDWLLRDAHHANIIVKLKPQTQKKYEEFKSLNVNNNFDIDVKGCEFCTIKDRPFEKLMDNLREELYSTIYEGLERSFTDSLLIRLAYSTINVLHKIGIQIAGNHITTRAIMGYLLMYDYLMKEYTNKILNLSDKHIDLLKEDQPITVFSSRSSKLSVIFDNLKCIMHYLKATSPKRVTRHIADLDVDMDWVDIMQIEKSLIMITASTIGKIIERAARNIKADEAEKIALLFHDIVAASRVDAIGVLKIPALETSLQTTSDRKNGNNYLLVNYYFFRKLDDNFRDEDGIGITSFKRLKKTLSEHFQFTPFLFILTDRKETASIQEIFDQVILYLIERFSMFFQTLDIQQQLKLRHAGAG